MVENATLAAVAPLDATYQHHLPQGALEQLSEVQMESVVYAGQQFAGSPRPSSERRGNLHRSKQQAAASSKP